MNGVVAFAAVGGACGLVILIAVLKQRAQILFHFLVRLIMGGICIFLVNDFLAKQGISVAVGLNPVSLLTSGSLGFSGVALLYAILLCKFL